MKKRLFKNLIYIVSILILFSQVVFSKTIAPDTGDVDRDFLKKHTFEEWRRLQDDTLLITEIPLRVEYFSPSYLGYYDPAYNSATANYRANGVDDDVTKTIEDTVSALDSAISELRKDDPKSEKLEALITQKKTLDKTRATLNRKFSSIYLQVGNNNQLQYVKFMLCKAMENAYTSYKLLEKYENLLKQQTELYKDVYVLTENNLLIGLATDVDVKSAYATYLNTKNNYDNMHVQCESVKQQIALTLGFPIEEVKDLEFVEPEIDFDYLLSINLEQDKINAYNSNTTYRSSSLKDFNAKAGSTFEQREIYRKRLQELIYIEMDELYNNIEVRHKEYDASIVANKIYEINKASHIRKKANGLLSNTQDFGLRISLLNDEIGIYNAKYNFIQALTNYKYATLGVTSTN